MYRRVILSFFVVTWCFFAPFLSSFTQAPTLKGTWQYCGGKFNNKIFPAPTDYTQLRKYGDTQFDAFLLEKGEKDVKYESGTYILSTDTCAETQTYCMQDQSMIGVTIRFHYTIRNDTLFLSGKLPNGFRTEDYWKRVK
jgi:hypothetical protein